MKTSKTEQARKQAECFERALEKAHAAASAAQQGMKEDHLGCNCGFAWVTIPGTSPLARYCRAQVRAKEEEMGPRSARRHYGSAGAPGWRWWCPGDFNGQEVTIHRVGAEAFARVLAEIGYAATVSSRLD